MLLIQQWIKQRHDQSRKESMKPKPKNDDSDMDNTLRIPQMDDSLDNIPVIHHHKHIDAYGNRDTANRQLNFPDSDASLIKHTHLDSSYLPKHKNERIPNSSNIQSEHFEDKTHETNAGHKKFSNMRTLKRQSTIRPEDFEEEFDKTKKNHMYSSSLSSESSSEGDSPKGHKDSLDEALDSSDDDSKKKKENNKADTTAAPKRSIKANPITVAEVPAPKKSVVFDNSEKQLELACKESNNQSDDTDSTKKATPQDNEDSANQAGDLKDGDTATISNPRLTLYEDDDERYQHLKRIDFRAKKTIIRVVKFKLRDDPTYKNIKWIVFPDDTLKERWDIVVIMLMMYIAVVIPLRLSFIDDSASGWTIADWVVNGLFIIDMIVNCFLAYFDSNDNLVTDRKKIFWGYVKSWFLIDIASIIPFDTIMESSSNYHDLLRLSRLPRLYRLFKIAKLVRMAKILRESNRILQYLGSIIKVSPQMERLIVSFIAIIAFVHISACAWKFILDFDTDDPNNWLVKNGFADIDDNLLVSSLDVYVACAYLIVQTIITVGYGDLPPDTTAERISACFWMFVGVFLYSFTIGSLASLISDMESTNAQFNKKHNILIQLKKEFKFGNKLYFRIKRALRYGTGVKQDNSEFLQELPVNMRLDLAYIIHKEAVDSIPLFQDKPRSFIAAIGPMLRPMRIAKGEYVYYEGDPADEIYFIKSGVIAFVLPKQYHRFKFLKIREGYFFGETDLLFYGEIRKYAAVAVRDSEFYVLNKKDFKSVFLVSFRDIGMEIVDNACNRKKRTKKTYKEAVEYIQSLQKEGTDPAKIRQTVFNTMNPIHEMLIEKHKKEDYSSIEEEDNSSNSSKRSKKIPKTAVHGDQENPDYKINVLAENQKNEGNQNKEESSQNKPEIQNLTKTSSKANQNESHEEHPDHKGSSHDLHQTSDSQKNKSEGQLLPQFQPQNLNKKHSLQTDRISEKTLPVRSDRRTSTLAGIKLEPEGLSKFGASPGRGGLPGRASILGSLHPPSHVDNRQINLVSSRVDRIESQLAAVLNFTTDLKENYIILPRTKAPEQTVPERTAQDSEKPKNDDDTKNKEPHRSEHSKKKKHTAPPKILNPESSNQERGQEKNPAAKLTTKASSLKMPIVDAPPQTNISQELKTRIQNISTLHETRYESEKHNDEDHKVQNDQKEAKEDILNQTFEIADDLIDHHDEEQTNQGSTQIKPLNPQLFGDASTYLPGSVQ